MDALTIDRLQFAFTIMFHYLFPITTMGLAPFVAFYPAGRGGLSIFDASPSPYALITALTVIMVGLLAVIAYSSIVWRQFATKVRIAE
jgi:cytochrome bd-type quinol oxidase subunit 2